MSYNQESRGGEGSTGTNGAKRKRGRKKGRNKFLNIMNINAQSLKHKMDELRTLVSDHKPHIIAITETWGKDSITDAAFQIEGYNMYRNDREDTNYKFGGGTLLYINKKLGQRTCKPLNCKSFESNTWCWVTPKQGKKILVGCIYTAVPVYEIRKPDVLRKPDVCPVYEAKFRKPVLAGLRSNNEMNIFGFRRCWNINCVFTYTYTISTTSTTSMITVWVAYITKTSTR